MLKLNLPLPVFRNAKEIVNGKNARLALKGINASKVALIITGSFYKSNYFEQIKRLINCDALHVVRKDHGEPTSKIISNILKELEDFGPDYIIALGGGSVIDAAKIAWVLYEHSTLNINDSIRPFSIPPLREKSQFAAIPTTIGSGSEVSSAAVFMLTEKSSKKFLVSHYLLPDLVILDPELVAEIPKNILRASIADSLSHAIEGYVSNIMHPLMDTFSEKSCEIIYSFLNMYNEKEWDIEMIGSLQLSSMLSGIVQNHCVVGLSHAIAHQLGKYKFSHGIANAYLMPSVIKYNSCDEKINTKYFNLCKRSGISSPDELIKIFKVLSEDQELPHIKKSDFHAIAKLALLDPAARTNPVKFSEGDVIKILGELYE
tara:strand:+ start:251 stop:1372 length:1122 start_codon:yes stop_codon:yes gene_type:complete